MADLTAKQQRFVEETWRSYPIDPSFSVSSNGRVRGKSGRILSGGGTRYFYIGIWPVARMVLETFVGCGEGLEANHLNGKKHDNRLCNLEWCTRSENMRHSFRVLGNTPVRGQKHGRAKFSDAEIAGVRAAVDNGETMRSVAARAGMSAGYVSRLARGFYR